MEKSNGPATKTSSTTSSASPPDTQNASSAGIPVPGSDFQLVRRRAWSSHLPRRSRPRFTSQIDISPVDPRYQSIDLPLSSSVESFYSCADLPADEPGRRILASQATLTARYWDSQPNGKDMDPQQTYPRVFHNTECLDCFPRGSVGVSLREAPLLDTGFWRRKSDPDAVRVIWPWGQPDLRWVCYHNVKKSTNRAEKPSVCP
ncbi:hypothetical protein BP00DRAFT_411844 [Aspergillus indologenus CBS 114.80]|uniref:Uncharacterized protein n=1 Tax=Aspergillus indologenus CBS 114.80 TaxID=1450541 RepID=A0A2V5IGW8_9EURO|nr:hypothetical protein BP00DRAFT_411844 [Aspergillus indologenus CBS 114.80]